MKTSKLPQVCKNDGATEPFSIHKLNRCIAVTLSDSGQDPDLAGPLSRAIALHIADVKDRPTSELIFQCAYAVLSRTGLSEAGERLRHHRESRAAKRRTIRVFDSAAEPPARAGVWNKSRLALWLEKTQSIGRPAARFVAREVERKVFSLDYRCLSGDLVQALARNELSAWGLLEEYGPGAADIELDLLAPASGDQEKQ